MLLESESDTQYRLDLNIPGEDGCTFGVRAEVQPTNNDFENLLFKEDIKKLTTQVRLQQIFIVTVSGPAAF
ncbi:MAG: hypothetical protein ABJH72_23195 [Reichenbachiella sp.]|uniref:hypothetical protein n=1 Tax=Reichenbachiella sp. TaxID=2184521 RepID=UPI00326535AD